MDPYLGSSTSSTIPPEYTHQEVEYRTPLPMPRTMPGPHRSNSATSLLERATAAAAAPATPGVVLIIDRNISTRAEAASLIQTLEQTLRDPHLDPATPVSLVTFGGTVSMYRVGRFGGEANTPFVLKSDVVDRALTGMDQQRMSAAFARGEYTVPLFAGREHLVLSLRNMVSDGTFRFADEGGDAKAKQVDKQDEGEEARFLGTAVDCLNQCYPHGRRARVLVFITGSPYGPGDEEKQPGPAHLPTDVQRPKERRQYFARLSNGARKRGLALDVFCLGLAAHLDGPCLHALVSRTGGAVLFYPSAQDLELAMDIYKVLYHQVLPDPTQLPTVELRVSHHMEIFQVLHADALEHDVRGEEAEAALSTHSTPPHLPGSYAGAAPPASIASGTRAVVQGVGARLGGWATSWGSWLTSQGALVPEGDSDFAAVAGGEVCGPSRSLTEGWNRKHAQEQAAGKALTPRRYPYWQGLRRLTLSRLRPFVRAGGDGATDLCLLYRPRDTVFGIWESRPDDFVFQCVLRYVEGDYLVTQVVTEKINSKSTSRDHAPLAVLAAKRAVASILQKVPAGNTAPAGMAARCEVDAVVQEVRTLYPSQHAFVRKRGGFGKPCGTEFAGALEQLYQAHRGCLLGYHQQGEDLAYTLRHRFLSVGMKEAARMMAPTMLSTGALTAADAGSEEAALRPWPCQTMAMWPDVILVLDTQDRIVIWVGREAAYMLAAGVAPPGDDTYAEWASFAPAAQRSLDACRAYAQQARQERFPTPHVLEITEGSPLERFLWARVVPTHKDSPDVLLANFPQLRTLAPARVEALRVQFASVPTDDESLQQYLVRLTPAAVLEQFYRHNTAAGAAAVTHYAHHHHPHGAASTSAQ